MQGRYPHELWNGYQKAAVIARQVRICWNCFWDFMTPQFSCEGGLCRADMNDSSWAVGICRGSSAFTRGVMTSWAGSNILGCCSHFSLCRTRGYPGSLAFSEPAWILTSIASCLKAMLVTFNREYYSNVFSSSPFNLSLYPFTPVETHNHHSSSGYWNFLYQKVIWWCPSERLFKIASFILSPPAVPEFFQHSKNISFIRSLVIWFLVLMLPFGTMAGCHSVCCCRRAVLSNLGVSFSLSF